MSRVRTHMGDDSLKRRENTIKLDLLIKATYNLPASCKFWPGFVVTPESVISNHIGVNYSNCIRGGGTLSNFLFCPTYCYIFV